VNRTIVEERQRVAAGQPEDRHGSKAAEQQRARLESLPGPVRRSSAVAVRAWKRSEGRVRRASSAGAPRVTRKNAAVPEDAVAAWHRSPGAEAADRRGVAAEGNPAVPARLNSGNKGSFATMAALCIHATILFINNGQ
jgi:hypothetical protein